jgi:hypothetical protein
MPAQPQEQLPHLRQLPAATALGLYQCWDPARQQWLQGAAAGLLLLLHAAAAAPGAAVCAAGRRLDARRLLACVLRWRLLQLARRLLEALLLAFLPAAAQLQPAGNSHTLSGSVHWTSLPAVILPFV